MSFCSGFSIRFGFWSSANLGIFLGGGKHGGLLPPSAPWLRLCEVQTNIVNSTPFPIQHLRKSTLLNSAACQCFITMQYRPSTTISQPAECGIDFLQPFDLFEPRVQPAVSVALTPNSVSQWFHFAGFIIQTL